MATPIDESRREHASTYIIQNRSSEDELKRLALQDQMVTRSMGGVLPEQQSIERLERVLDVGCGTGGWLIEVAKAYPAAPLLIGVDVSKRLLDYAREQARLEGVADRVEFHSMDALRMLEFPTNFFDLVNMRFGLSYLRTWDWPKLLQEFQRVARVGGIVRVTDSVTISKSNSPAHMRLREIGVQAFYQAGHAFTPEAEGVLDEISRLLKLQGLLQVETRLYQRVYRAGTAEGQLFIEDIQQLFRTVRPFLRRWTHVPEDYEATYQQMLVEMQQPDFAAEWDLVTVWGMCPMRIME